MAVVIYRGQYRGLPYAYVYRDKWGCPQYLSRAISSKECFYHLFFKFKRKFSQFVIVFHKKLFSIDFQAFYVLKLQILIKLKLQIVSYRWYLNYFKCLHIVRNKEVKARYCAFNIYTNFQFNNIFKWKRLPRAAYDVCAPNH